MSQLIQYVIVRADLATTLGWPLGAIIAQCCHATTAVNHLHHDDPLTREYFADLDNMHKVVLAAPDETALRQLADKLQADAIGHKMWVEQPEAIVTCVALKPYRKEQVQGYVRKFKLLK